MLARESGRLDELLIGRGRYWITLDEVQQLTGRSREAARVLMSRLMAKARFFSPARGLYVVVPAEYRAWGAVPGDWFIDPLMRHLGRAYYVSMLTAAAMHGASHQAPQVFQAVVDARTVDRDFGRVRLRFFHSRHAAAACTEPRNSRTGTFVLASKETTVIDLLRHPSAAGGLDNIATVLREIGELDGTNLAAYASLWGHALPRRAGWMVEQFGHANDLRPLQLAARLDQGQPPLLAPGGPARGRADRTWRLRLNATVEPEL